MKLPLLRFIVFALVLLSMPVSAFSQRDYINITDPNLRKIPIAIPAFKTFTGKPEEARLSVNGADLLAETLEFTGYFKMIDRAAYLYDPTTSDIVGTGIPFRNFTAIGAELLITGGVFVEKNVVDMELRLFDTFKGELLVGKRYKGWTEDSRRIIRRFCTEVIKRLTGSEGFFNSKIAFTLHSGGKKEIYACDFDGHDPEPMTDNGSINISPAWSSDGKWLAYTSYSRGNPDLFIRNLQEKTGTVVSKKGINISPAWAPGKSSLAATLSFTGDPEIYLLTGTGKIIKKLTNSWGIDVSPSWSPDGKRIAFVSNRSGAPQVYIMEVDSGRTERLTYTGRYNTTPAWSPRGDHIAYSAMEGSRSDILLMGVDGSGPIYLTHDAGDNDSPTWSPDGSLIAFVSNRSGRSRIYVMTAFGTDQRPLLSLEGEQSYPRWSPNGVDD